MPTIRSLRQPGPVHPNRIDRCRGDIVPLRYALASGLMLNEAVTGPLVEAGFQCGTVVFQDLAVGPFQYVMPGPADNESHVAYFSAPRAPEGITQIERANVTFGWADGKPFIHCHAVWREANGSRRGGHILPRETIIAEAGEASAWGFRGIRIEATPDPETNFTLFQPSGGEAGRDLVVRVKPNEDILGALESVGIRDGVVRGSLGSLIGASFADGGRVGDDATEVLVREGRIRDGVAALDLLVVDMRGEVHEGWLQRGGNPVCITFDVFLEAVS
jgi:predicted DNA-binding protein with PD1-like motif